MKFLIDMNLTPEWVKFFEQHNIKSVHWSTVGKVNANDFLIFEYARKNKFIVFTNDLDFGSILAATNAKAPSVFQLRSQELLPQYIGKEVMLCISKYKEYLLDGSLITFEVEKLRVRLLPLGVSIK